MTVQLPPYKVKRVLRGYFGGQPQTRIAREAGVDQATVSHYATRFKKIAAQIGIQAAGKEYGVLTEVDGLRSLSVELNKSRLSVEEARRGHGIVRAFLKLGVKPEEHQTLVKVCQQVGNPAFVHAAVNLVQVESQTGIPYHELISRCEQAQRNLPATETKLTQRQAELKSVSDEISKNKQELAAQRKELEQHQAEVKTKEMELDAKLTAKMEEVAVKEKEVEGAVALKSILTKKGLKLETLMKLSQEFGEGKGDKLNAIDSAKLSEALEKFGSLQKANVNLEAANETIWKWNEQLKQEYPKLATAKAKLAINIKDMKAEEDGLRASLRNKHEQLESLGSQYELFCGFITMVAGSPSVTESTDGIIALFQALKGRDWYLSQSAEEMKGSFIRVIMGDYLKSFRCEYCGSKFITNGKPGSKSKGNYYVCPVCQFMSSVKADDSFLKALVPGKRLEDIHLVEELLKENEVLKPFKAFLNAPCEMCHQPMTKWDDSTVELVIEGIGYGHISCWNTELGRQKIFLRTLERIKKEGK